MSTGTYKTPGVYVVEKNAFPSSVVEVATAVPVFIGYTQKAQIGDTTVWRKPVTLTSFREFVQIFGGAQRGTLKYLPGPAATVTAAPAAIDPAKLAVADPALGTSAKEAATEAKKLDDAVVAARREVLTAQGASDAADALLADDSKSAAERQGATKAKTDADVAGKIAKADTLIAITGLTKAVTKAMAEASAAATALLPKVSDASAPELAAKLNNAATALVDAKEALFNSAPSAEPEVATIVDDVLTKATAALLALRNVSGGSAPSSTAGAPAADMLTYSGSRYLLHDALRLFFDNGGGKCYVVAGAKFADDGKVEKTSLWDDDIDEELKRTAEPTIVVIPDATQLELEQWQEIGSKVIMHCQGMQSRIALLDVYGVEKQELNGGATQGQLITKHANTISAINAPFPSYGAVYYPWLETTVVQDNEVDFRQLDDDARARLCAEINREASIIYKEKADKLAAVKGVTTKVGASRAPDGEDAATYHAQLTTVSPVYKRTMQNVRRALNVLPPSAAMAGVYTYVDNTQGVWKAPANTGLTSVVAPTILITHEEQQDLNVPLNGKAINCIRVLPGRGVVVWGARTLDGNSQDWRYVNVRRTMIMLEQSIKAAAQAYVFQPNVQSTWVTVRGMIENYLTNKWKQGALMGATPAEAFSVEIGLGSTMDANDVLDGYMRVSIKVAISRPAEFIELTFIQQMLTAS